MPSSLTIGRAQDNSIVLAHPQISGHHAELSLVDRETRRFRIRDLQSANGVFKNGEKVMDAQFGPEDTISLANVDLAPSLYLPYFVAMETPPAVPGTAVAPEASRPSATPVAEAPRPRRRRSGALRVLGWMVAGLVIAAVIYLAELRYAPQAGFELVLPGPVQAIGYLAVLWSLLWVTLSLVGSVHRLAHERRQQDLDLQLWQARLEASRRKPAAALGDDAGWNGFRKFEIARKFQEGGGICSFYLVPHDRKPLPAFRPGQYLTFQLHISGQPRPVIRCYSLSDSPYRSDYYRVSIKKVPPPRDKPELPPGLSSSFFHDQLKEGDILDVKAPGGHFFLDMEKETPVVLIGGGVGLTPVLSMLNAIAASGSQRETWLFYGVRNSREQVMAEHLRRVEREHPNISVHVCYSNPEADDQEGVHYDHAERVGITLFKRLLPSNNYDFYICGPPPMMDSLTAGLEEWGVPRKHIHFEAFGPASAKRVTHAEGSAKPTAGAFEVRFERSGKSCQWTNDAGSLLDLAEANGVDIDFGCRAGNCGTCAVAVREGKVDVINEPGFQVEEGSCLVCVSRPEGKLVLDA
jgi:ferredoxin-NADP reductase